MQISISGEMSITDLRQAIFEKLLEAEHDYAVRYSLGATIYINPTNGCGEKIKPYNRNGRSVEKLHSTGPYRSAADDYKL